VFIVRALHTVVGDRLGTITRSPEARFSRACVAAFTLAGKTSSPDKAIQAYADSLNDSPPETRTIRP
jgi:hypothetical protein